MRKQAASMKLFTVLDPIPALKRIVCGIKASASSTLAQICALMILFCMATDPASASPSADPADFAHSSFTALGADAAFKDAVLRMAHPSQPSSKLRAHAARLLQRMLTPTEWAVRHVHASAHLLDMLSTIQPQAATPLCSICMAPHEDDNEADEQPQFLPTDPAPQPKDLVYLPCFHTFHKHCMHQWFSQPHAKDACPMCATPVLANIHNALH